MKLREIGSDLLIVLGSGAAVYGVYGFSEPAAFIVGGSLVAVFGWFLGPEDEK